MVTQHTSFLLKVLGGINAGASVRLKTGSLVIGHSMACDIILHDEAIAERHVQLMVGADRILLKPLVQPVLVDGNDIGGSSVELQLYQVVRIGGVEFFVADANVTVDVQAVKRKSRERAEVRNGRPQAPAAGVGAPKPAAAFARKGSGWQAKHYLWLGLALLVLGNALYFSSALWRFSEVIGLKETPAEHAASLLQQLNAPGLAAVKNTDGTVSIGGYVGTVAQKNEVLGSLARLDAAMPHRILAQEELVGRAEVIAHSLGEQGIKFRAVQDGHLLAEGFVTDEARWVRVKANILADIAGVQAVDDQNIQTLPRYLGLLRQFVDKNGLSSRLELSADKGRIIVGGELTKNEIDRWKELKAEFIATFGLGPEIVENVYDVRQRIKLAIRSVSVGKVPFLVSKDGKKYMEGSTLGENYFVKSIKPDYVLLVKSGVEIPIYYGLEEKKNDVADRAKLDK